MRTWLLVVALLHCFLSGTIYGDDQLPADFKSAEVNADIKKLSETEATLRSLLQARLSLARQELIDKLKAHQTTATQAGDLDEALKIRNTIQRLEDIQAGADRGVAADKGAGETTPEKAAPVKPQIPRDAVKFGKSRYYVITTPMSLAAAQKLCAERGGHLARISSAEEHAFCAKLIAPLPSNKRDMQLARIDGNDTAEQGKYVFEDGTPVTYLRWDKDKPVADVRCRYLLLYSVTGLYHNGMDIADPPCPFICEWD